MKTLKTKARNRLTYAAKRNSITLPSVMSIKIPFNGEYIECSTPAEAIEVLKFIESNKKITHRTPSAMDNATEQITALFGKVETSAWTRESFWRFLENLGAPQKLVLSLLVRVHKVSDEELRKLLDVDNNQALAGVLSGISKQAGILNIPARSVYTVEDERRGGELTKTYAVARDFLRVATEMNWPEG